MNFLHKLQTAPFDREDPLKPLEDIYGPINDWIEQGFDDALEEAMRIEHSQLKAGEISDKTNVLKYFAILNEIIPSRPLEDMLDEAFRYKQNSMIQFQTSIIDRLISKVLPCIIDICDNIFIEIYDNEDLHLISSVLLRAIFNASHETMENNFSRINIYLETLNDNCIFEYAGIIATGNSMFMNILFAIVERFPAGMCKDSFEPGIILRLRFFLNKKCYASRYQRKTLKKWYDENNVDEVLEQKLPSWKPMLEASKHFQASDITSALTILRDLIDQDLLDAYHLVQSNILDYLKEILTSSDDETNIKTFLTIFLKFKTQPGYQYTWDNKSYIDLVELIGISYIILMLVLHAHKDETYSNDFRRLSVISDMSTTLQILQALHILNESWSYWFDIVDAPVIFCKTDVIRNRF